MRVQTLFLVALLHFTTHAASRSPCSVAFYGDSVLHGMSVGTARLSVSPATHLRKIRPALQVEDKSVPGAAAVVFAPVLALLPEPNHIVVIQYGINDINQATPEQYRSALGIIVEHLRKQHRQVIITGLSRGTYGGRDQFNEAARQVAARTNSEYADWGSVAYEADSTLDGTHAGQKYSQRLTERVAEAIDEVAPMCSQ